MSRFKHTPGKWEIDPENEDQIFSDKGDGNLICFAPLGLARSMEFWPANAKLIAAAPEMYDELFTIVNDFNKGIYPITEDIERIQTLLNKINNA